MSLVNDLLRDLDARQAPAEERAALAGLQAVEHEARPERQRRRRRLLLAALSCLLLAAATLFWWQRGRMPVAPQDAPGAATQAPVSAAPLASAAAAPEAGPQPQPQPQPKGPWRRDPKTCTIVRDPKATNALKTQACIAWNVCQAMTDAYNRGYATGRSNSKNHKGRCRNADLDSAWLNQRLKRIILSQDNPQTHRRTLYSRKKP